MTHEATQNLPTALLLLGPTGVGKTPLGEALEGGGLWGRRCEHFDFGANLRRGAAGQLPNGLLSDDERRFLANVLESGALLEDEQFAIAQKILGSFMQERGIDAGTMIVLNGLPRHTGQAAAMQALVTVRAVISLTCTPETVLERVRTDAGGDRAGRGDDDPDAVRRRLAIYAERTSPLVAYYRERGAHIVVQPVGLTTTADGLRTALQETPVPL